MTITITIPDNIKQEVFAAVATKHGYKEESGVTLEQFTKDTLMNVVKEALLASKSAIAIEEAVQAKKEEVELSFSK